MTTALSLRNLELQLLPFSLFLSTLSFPGGKAMRIIPLVCCRSGAWEELFLHLRPLMVLLQQPESPVYKGRIYYSLQTSALSFGLSKGWHVLLSWLTLTSWDSEDHFLGKKKCNHHQKKNNHHQKILHQLMMKFYTTLFLSKIQWSFWDVLFHIIIQVISLTEGIV